MPAKGQPIIKQTPAAATQEERIASLEKVLADVLTKTRKLIEENKTLWAELEKTRAKVAEQTGDGPAPAAWRAVRVSNVGGLYPVLSTPSNPGADVHASEAAAVEFARKAGGRFDGEKFTVLPLYDY